MKMFYRASLVLLCMMMVAPSAYLQENDGDTLMVVKILFQNRGDAYARLRPLRLTYEDVRDTWAQALVSPDELI